MKRSKYLVASKDDERWGLTVSTVGYEDIGPTDDYPTKGHAEGYYFNVQKGRTLNEYQLQYIVEGEGTFCSSSVPTRKLRQGDSFLLFPGEHHTYRPQPGVGWKCYWIGFRGRNMDERVRAGFLSCQRVVYHLGYSADMVKLFGEALDVAEREQPFVQQRLAGIVNHLLGMMYSLDGNRQLDSAYGQQVLIAKARQRIRQEAEGRLTIQQLAEELNMSYSSFRKLFKEYAGYSPARYQQELRLQRAKELLSTTQMSIKEIAYALDFSTPDYFSNKFRQKTKMTPREYRDATQ